jgi:nitrite reductase/ring-hydroxylating ferredoxin subunit
LNIGAPQPVPPVRVCASSELVDGAHGVRFPIRLQGASLERSPTAFAIRFEGLVYGYVNRCAHVPMEMDWRAGEFFDHSGLYLICATHGAMYEPESGYCVGGPCRGARLIAITMLERDSEVFWQPDVRIQPP